MPSLRTQLNLFDNCVVFVDLFGGSGLLSRMVKDARPDAKVIYNDFDGFCKRIENIPRTNALLADFRKILKDCADGKLIKDPFVTAVIDRIKQEEETGLLTTSHYPVLCFFR